MTVVVEEAVASGAINMSNTAIMNTPMQKKVLMVITTVMVMIMVVSEIILISVQQRAVLACPPGSGVLLSAKSRVLWVVATDKIFETGIVLIIVTHFSPRRPVEAV